MNESANDLSISSAYQQSLSLSPVLDRKSPVRRLHLNSLKSHKIFKNFHCWYLFPGTESSTDSYSIQHVHSGIEELGGKE